MAESWGEEDEVITVDDGDWGVEDEVAQAVDTPPPADPARKKTVDMFGRPMDYTNAGEMSADQEALMAGPEALAGLGEAAATVGSAIVAEPLAGIAGIAGAIVPGQEGQGGRAVEATREALTYQPKTPQGQQAVQTVGEVMQPIGEAFEAVESFLGDNVYDATGSAALAAGATAVPTALAEILGLGLMKKSSTAAQEMSRLERGLRDMDAAQGDTAAAAKILEGDAKPFEDVATDLGNAKITKVAGEVRPDQEILDAAEELGIELNPSHYSTNEAYRRVEQAVKEQPNSELFAKEAKALEDLRRAADESITDIDGVLDRSSFDSELRERMTTEIKGLEEAADGAFKLVGENIPQKAKMTNPRTSQALIDRRLEELGGDMALLQPVERKLYRLLSRTRKDAKGKDTGEPIAPTWNALDTLRRDVGQGYKRKGEFKDDETGVLDQVYGALIEDQKRAAKLVGAGEVFEAAQDLVRNRKAIEQRAMYLFGKKMDQSMLRKMTASAAPLTRGETANFKNMMDALPEDMRPKAAATFLNDMYALGARTKNGLGDGFANAYTALERNPGAKKELFKYLPEETQRRFDAIGKVSAGIHRARRFENKSGSGRVVLEALRDGSMIEKIVTNSVSSVARVVGWKTAGHFGAAAVDKADKAIFDKNRRVKAADELMASPGFSAAINKAMEGKIAEADVMLKRSPVWRAFRNTLGEGTKQQLAAVGPIAWLTEGVPQEEQQNVE